jgi:hypothetical protein
MLFDISVVYPYEYDERKNAAFRINALILICPENRTGGRMKSSRKHLPKVILADS